MDSLIFPLFLCVLVSPFFKLGCEAPVIERKSLPYRVRSLYKTVIKEGRSETGFSLLEVAIVLTLMGILGASVLPYLSDQRAQGRLVKSRAHQELIFASLANYALTHHKLPCPATDLESGVAPPQCFASQFVGAVPYATLGFSKTYATDGWGQPYIYVVDALLTERISENGQANSSLKKFCECEEKSTYANALKISLASANAENKVMAPEKDILAVILISRGEAGLNPKGVGERLNENKTLTFADFPYSTREKSLHRHRLQWWTRNHLLSHYADFSCPGFLAKSTLDEEKNTPMANHAQDFESLPD